MINILFFAKYREKIGLSHLQVSCAALSVVADLIAELERIYKDKASFLNEQNLLISVNQELATARTPIKTGDEIAFFPPVTGG